MAQNDDITDAFDDDDLRASIESADKSGQWRDQTAAFADPKVQELAQKLARAPSENYTERRLQELQRRIAAKEASVQPTKSTVFGDQILPLEKAFPDAPSPDDWREPAQRPATQLPALPTLQPPKPRTRVLSPREAMLSCLQSLGTSMAVFGIAAAVQGLISGWTTGLLVRSALAAIVVGVTWHLTAAGRFRSAAIGIGVHLLTFLTYTDSGNQTQLLSTLLGMLIVLIGSGAAGMIKEEAPRN